jgi:flagellar motor switch protein FliM
MSGMLNNDEVAALVEAAKQGQVPEQGQSGRRGQRVRTVDFSRPTKFTSDHQRRIVRALDTFCQTAVTRLSAELRVPLELETVNTMQLTWSAAQTQLPPGSLAIALDVQPIGTRMLLTVEQAFVLTAIECLLGGSPDHPPKERRFTEIDWTLTRRLLASIVAQLSAVWEDLGRVTLEAGEIEEQNDASQVASVSEPTFVVAVECRMNKQSSTLGLLIPWMAIEPISLRVAGREKPEDEEDAAGMTAIARAVSAASVTLRAEVASVDVPIQEILSLEPGSVVRLGARADRGVGLFAENVKLAGAQPGSSGRRRAVQIRGMGGAA